MFCKCGKYYHDILVRDQNETYLVVRDRDYLEFLKLEQAAISSTSEGAKLRILAESSKYAGTLMRCSQCGRLIFRQPGGMPIEFYQLEIGLPPRK